ncbi:MAG: transcription termination factor Rho [Bacteroidota bacterium]
MTTQTTEKTASGLLEIDHQHGGFLRQVSMELETGRNDLRMSLRDIRKWNLREGCLLEYTTVRGHRGYQEIAVIQKINGIEPSQWQIVEEFSRRTAVTPSERLRLTTGAGDTSMRVVDLLCPIGKGQRCLIVAPPRTGKTMLMQQFASAISSNHPEIDLVVLLVDERPEEVTDMRRTIRGEVFASSSDSDREQHVRLAKLVLEYAKRKVEAGRDVVLLLDSLTKMGRAFNAVQKNSGRTLSGGVDIRALEIPKRIFGAARACEGGGSLTIIATALIETNSRMDELIFQEFKGTGNMELVLSRDLSNDRIYPAINIQESGTRHEEILFGRETQKYQLLRRALNKMKPKDAMLNMLKLIEQYDTNRKLLTRLNGFGEEE